MAQDCGVEVRTLDAIAEFRAAEALFGAIWGRESFPPMTMETMRALQKSGNYVAGVFKDAALVGAAAGFFEAPSVRALHSHIGAVVPGAAGRGVGRALKLHQRAWGLANDLTAVVWTYDPLVRRNAYFNLVKLAARPTEYLPDFYGTMADAINAGDQSDRLLLHWDLLDPDVTAAARSQYTAGSAPREREQGAAVTLGIAPDGAPVPIEPPPVDRSGPDDAAARYQVAVPPEPIEPPPAVRSGPDDVTARYLIAVPPDIEGLRVSDPALALRWRSALREALVPLLRAGGRVTGFDREGWYIVQVDADRPSQPGDPPN